LYTLERLEDAQARGAKIYAEIGGYHVNSDASDYVLPNPQRQAECIRAALARGGMAARDIHIVNTHATATPLGDIQECEAIRAVFGEGCPDTHINNTKSYIRSEWRRAISTSSTRTPPLRRSATSRNVRRFALSSARAVLTRTSTTRRATSDLNGGARYPHRQHARHRYAARRHPGM